MKVCLATNHLLRNTSLGGHAWVFLNWALGLQALGCELVFLEQLGKNADLDALPTQLRGLRSDLSALGIEAAFALVAKPDVAERCEEMQDQLDAVTLPWPQVAEESDLLLNFRYLLPADVVDRFARSALVDIDPGLLQCWMDGGQLSPVRHDLYFTIGETVGQPGAKFADCGIDWIHSPPVVHLDAWPVAPPTSPDAPYTTVTNWWGKYEVLNGATVGNYKRTYFMECLDLPARAGVRVELAIHHDEGDPSEMELLQQHGFGTRIARDVSATPRQYREYITASRGEFSCAKPSCMLLQNAWISDRTLCYLASGRPAIVQHTGPSKMLPDMEGLLRFHDVAGAERCLRAVEADYDHHAAAGRRLVEEHFAAERVLRVLLERALSIPARRRRGSH